TSNLLLGKPLPTRIVWSSITKNIGDIVNEGVEFQISTDNIRTSDFRWTSSFNISYNENEVTSLVGSEEALSSGSIQPVAVGHDIDAWKMYQWAGVNPADGRPMWYDKNGNITYDPDPEEDRKFSGFSSEPLIGGFNNTFNYKGLTVDIFFQFMFGQEALPSQVYVWGINQVGISGTNGVERRLTEAWRKPGDFAQYPAPTNGYQYPGT